MSKAPSTAARHSSASFEWQTPPPIVEASRTTMGGIDLDPASSIRANLIVRAKLFFTRRDDGLRKSWRADRVFLNPPGGVDADNESRQRRWWFALSRAWSARLVEQAIFVCFSVELLQTTQAWPIPGPIPLDFPLCFPAKRLKYLRVKRGAMVTGKAPPHASCVVFLPPRGARDSTRGLKVFAEAFAPHGRVLNLNWSSR